MKWWKILIIALLIVGILITALFLYLPYATFGFSRKIDALEQQLRQELVATAESWLGTAEGQPEHEQIIQIYNSHEPLAVDYMVTLEDNWCAAFVSAIAIQRELTGIIPTECGCERQTLLWKDMGRWQETDTYLPLPGDLIYYAWDEEKAFDDCTGWADHVGIVVGTFGPFIKVIEGNYQDHVGYRIINRWDFQIRGYGLPDYASITQ